MAAPSWRDFYEALTANAQSVSRSRAQGIDPSAIRLQYGNAGVYGKGVGGIKLTNAKPKGKRSSFQDKAAIAAQGLPLVGSYLAQYMATGDENSPGGRVLDVLSRGMYASSGAQKKFAETQGGKRNLTPANIDLGDYRDILSAGWKGLKGETKNSARDIAEVYGENNNGLAAGIRNFAYDVITDPTTYVGAGLIKTAADGVMKGTAGESIRVAAKSAPNAAKPAHVLSKKVTARPTNDLAEETKIVGDTLAVPEQSFAKFLERLNVDRNAQNPGDNVFQSVIDQNGNPITAPARSSIPAFERTFIGDTKGAVGERFQIAGPTPEVITARASIKQDEDIASKMFRFDYDEASLAKAGNGWFREETKRIPITPDDTPSGYVPNPNSTVAMERQAVRERYANLGDAGMPQNEVARAIMQRVDEPVYQSYQTHVIEVGGKKQTVWRPDPDADFMYMGQLREELMNPNLPPQRAKRLKEMLVNHLQAVNSYAKTAPEGFGGARGYDRFYQEMYGVTPKQIAKGKGKVKFDDLPPSPIDQMPTYTEVKEWVKLPWQEKLVFQHQMSGILTPADLAYLSRAGNKPSFDTRLQTLMDRAVPVQGLDDLINALDTGRITALDEPGIPELLKKYNVKTLKQLSKALKAAVKKKGDVEKKWLGKFAVDAEGNAPGTARMGKTVKSDTNIKELGPTGEEYKYYPGKAKIQKQAAAAKKKAETTTPAEAIVQAVKEGDKSALTAPKAVLNESQRQVFNRAAEIAIKKNVFDIRNREIWKFFTKTGVIRTDKVYNKGKGNVPNTWNAYKQYDFWRAMFSEISSTDEVIKAALNNANVRGKDRLMVRADLVYEQFMPAMKAMDDVLKQGGIFPTIGTKASDIPLSFYEILDEIDPNWVKSSIFRVDKSGSFIAPTQLMNAIESALLSIKSGDLLGKPDDLAQILFRELDEVKKTRGGATVPNGFHKWANSSKVNEGDIEDFLEPLVQALPGLAQRVEKNAAQKALWTENNINKTSQAAMDEIARRVVDPSSSIADKLKLADDVEHEIIPKVTRSSQLDDDSKWVVGQTVRAALPDLDLPVGIQAEAKRAKSRAGAKTKAAKTDIDVAAMRESTEQAAKIIGEEEMKLADTATQFEQSLGHRFLSAIFPHLGNHQIRPMFLEHKSTMQTVARTYQGQLSALHTKHAKDDILAAWTALRNDAPASNPAVKAAMDDLNKAIGVMFHDDDTFSMFGRNGLTAKEIDAHFDHFKIPNKFRMKSDAKMHSAWKKWDTTDPLDLLGKVFAASTTTLGKKLLGDQMMLEFGSKVKKPGYVKLANHGEELLKYVDTDSYYFPKEIAGEMRILNEFLSRTMKPSESGPLLRMYDKIFHSYKTGLTIYRFGHHVRNMTGDVWLSFMAGVNNPMAYTDGLKIMKSLGRKKYNDFDAVAALVRGEKVPVKEGVSNDIILYTRINGKKTPMRAHDIYYGLYNRGVLNDYRTLDDLGAVGAGGEADELFKNFKPFGGKVHNAAATISESRDHWVRLSHASDILKKGNFKSLDEAYEQAGRTVRKWHPDGSDLTHFESNFMRRGVLFYSWIRKAIPLILEGMVMQPGKAIMYPKFMYNMAEANGIDLESMSNPFPTDQMFPNWITDNLAPPIMGEKGSYKAIDPGIPMMDVLGDFAGEETDKSTFASMLTPALKLPIEMLMGEGTGAVATDLRTGIPYFDKSDYVDKQIPNSGLFVNSTGRSLTQPWQAKGGSEKEINTDNRERTLINFLTGMGLMPIDKPGYVKQAKREATQERNKR